MGAGGWRLVPGDRQQVGIRSSNHAEAAALKEEEEEEEEFIGNLRGY